MNNNHTIFLSAVALSALVFAGCSSSSETTSAPSPSATTPLDLGTYIPPSSSATPSAASSSPSASSSGRTAAEPSQTASSAGAVPTLASGKSVEMTDAELAKYRAGEYVPATEKHPAYNVPMPVMPAEAKEKTAEGAAAFYYYWVETRNYALRTGEIAPALNVTSQEFSDQMKLLDAIQKHYEEGSWVVNAEYSGKVVPNSYTEFSDPTYQIKITTEAEAGASYDEVGTKTEDLKATSSNDNPISLTLNWTEDGWIVVDTSGIAGVKYEDK